MPLDTQGGSNSAYNLTKTTHLDVYLIASMAQLPLIFNRSFLWSPYVIGQTIIFSSCGFFFLLLLSFFPRLISAVGDWMSTILPHMVWP